MKQGRIMNLVMVMLLVLCTVMTCVIFTYSENTILKADRTSAVAAFNL